MAMTIDTNNRDKVLADYRKKLTEHREVEARLKQGKFIPQETYFSLATEMASNQFLIEFNL